MNKHGKCLAVETTARIKPSENGAKIVQSTCNPTEKGQLWKYDKHISAVCNDWNKCLAIPIGRKYERASAIFQWDLFSGEKHQIWALHNINHFANLGNCLSIDGTSDHNGLNAITYYCHDVNDKGQFWSFVQLVH